MKGHVTVKDLTGLIQGRFNARRASLIERHLSACRECSATYEFMKQTVSPAGWKRINPSRKTHDRVMDFYDSYAARMQKVRTVREAASARPKLRPSYAASIAAVACAGILGIVLIWHPWYETAPLQASRVTGHVSADRKTLQKGQQIKPGVLLTTGENSKLSLMHGRIMKLIAGPHTRIAITKSRIDRKTGKVFFEMHIDKGTIIAVFDKAGNLEYTLKTPHGKISSSGSNIAMKVDPLKTRVMVKNGSANISSAGGTSVSTEEGNGYSITANEVTTTLEPSDDNENTLYDSTVNELLDEDDDDSTIN